MQLPARMGTPVGRPTTGALCWRCCIGRKVALWIPRATILLTARRLAERGLIDEQHHSGDAVLRQVPALCVLAASRRQNAFKKCSAPVKRCRPPKPTNGYGDAACGESPLERWYRKTADHLRLLSRKGTEGLEAFTTFTKLAGQSSKHYASRNHQHDWAGRALSEGWQCTTPVGLLCRGRPFTDVP